MDYDELHNPACDGAHCWYPTGEVRVLPLSKNDSSNLILCHKCYLHEIAFRVERNRELSADCRFDLPKWESLKVYDAGE